MPIEVSTAEDLDNIRNNPSADYVQTADIDLSEYDWNPIGHFDGSYDGSGYTIKKLNCSGSDTNVGLFGLLYDATILNLRLKFALINGSSDVGVIAGYQYEGTIEGCSVTDSNITGDNNNTCGGLVGYSYNAKIKNSFARGEIQAEGIIGGLVGYNSGTEIDKCYAACKILYTTDDDLGNLGGLVGYSCDAKIKNSFARGEIQARDTIGGLVGTNDNSGIDKCYAACKILYTTDDYLGGLVGDNLGVVDNSYYDSNVSGQSDTGKGIPRTTEEMTYPAADNTYEDWDFNNIWYIYDFANNGYPVLEEKQQPEDPYLLHFLETPQVKIQPPSANCVTVRSPTAKYTAEVDNISEDKKVERLVEIDEGDQEVCKTVAEQLLERWSKELKSVSGPILLNQDLEFKKKVNIVHQEAMIEEDMTVQKLEHDIIAYRTRVTAGDIILSDEELLARILDEI